MAYQGVYLGLPVLILTLVFVAYGSFSIHSWSPVLACFNNSHALHLFTARTQSCRADGRAYNFHCIQVEIVA